MLTGTAVPYLHNGIMSADENDATNFEVCNPPFVKGDSKFNYS